MTKRNEWVHNFPIKQVLEAVREKISYHKERLGWWEEEEIKAKEAMQGSLELREQQYTGGAQHVAVFDQQKQDHYNECRAKAREHREEMERLGAFEALLRAKEKSTGKIELDVEDVRYFRVSE